MRARELDRLLGERGKPATIVSDNGSELSCNECDGLTITRWPGTISRRGRAERLVESFIGRLRDELLNETLFRSLAQTRAVLEAWRAD
jgi:putative transposase